MENINSNLSGIKMSPIENVQIQDFMTPMVGSWQPSIDPLLIGPSDYKTLKNIRYKKDGSGIEGISGYYDFNSNAIVTYLTISTGIHFRSNRTDDSYVIVHGRSSTGAGAIFYSSNSVGGTEGAGEFVSTPIHTDSDNNLVPELAVAPRGAVAYCNKKETKIWGGNEIDISSVLSLSRSSTSSDAGYFEDSSAQGWSFPLDETEEITNRQTDQYFILSHVPASITEKSGFLVFSTRILKGIKVYIPSGYGNTNAANTNAIEVNVWNGTDFVAVSSLSDGTSKMTQTGTLQFDSTIGTANLYYYEDRYLYAYFVSMESTSGTSSCRVYQVTADAPVQDISNVWDGIFRQPIQAQRYDDVNDTYEDYTLHVSEQSTTATPVGLYIGAMSSAQHFILTFQEQISAVKFFMLGSLVNKTASQIIDSSPSYGAEYWNGTDFIGAPLVDRTLDSAGDTSFSKTGVVSWDVPSDEEKTSLFGTTGYSYRFSVNATTSGANPEDVVVDLIGGIPARKAVKVYKFPVSFREKLFLCGYAEGNEGNRIDFSLDDTPDVFNGTNSSLDGAQSIYVGSIEELTTATQLYNRFGSNIYTILIILKDNETWLLTGGSPEEYKLYPISFNLGCPAPKTITTAEVGFELGEQVERNVAMWISHQGPVMFDGAVIHPLTGLESYFDPNHNNSINFDYLSSSQAFFDSVYQEWNILLPSGDSTTLNLWLVYNIRLRKWFKKDVGANQKVICGIPSVATNGRRYIYGGSDNGKLYQLESGTSWDGGIIEYEFETGDFFPSGNQWDVTVLRRLQFFMARSPGDTSEVQVEIKTDSSTISNLLLAFTDVTSEEAYSGNEGVLFTDDDVFWSGVDESLGDIPLNTGLNRTFNSVLNCNRTGLTHSIRLTLSSSISVKGFELLMWGFQYYVTRKNF